MCVVCVTSRTALIFVGNSYENSKEINVTISVGEYILDFYCPELKLGIELDGQGHYTIEGSLRDGSRDNRLSARGITVLRIENRAIFENQPAVIELLKETVRRLKASGQSV